MNVHVHIHNCVYICKCVYTCVCVIPALRRLGQEFKDKLHYMERPLSSKIPFRRVMMRTKK